MLTRVWHLASAVWTVRLLRLASPRTAALCGGSLRILMRISLLGADSSSRSAVGSRKGTSTKSSFPEAWSCRRPDYTDCFPFCKLQRRLRATVRCSLRRSLSAGKCALRNRVPGDLKQKAACFPDAIKDQWPVSLDAGTRRVPVLHLQRPVTKKDNHKVASFERHRRLAVGACRGPHTTGASTALEAQREKRMKLPDSQAPRLEQSASTAHA